MHDWATNAESAARLVGLYQCLAELAVAERSSQAADAVERLFAIGREYDINPYDYVPAEALLQIVNEAVSETFVTACMHEATKAQLLADVTRLLKCFQDVPQPDLSLHTLRTVERHLTTGR